MRTRVRSPAVVTALVLAALAWGCKDTTPIPIAPTRPTPIPSTPTPAPEPAVLYTLSGFVFEVTSAGKVPIEGVEVYCEPCGPPDGHSFRFTGSDGVYSFTGTGGVATHRFDVGLAKPGYKLPNQPDLSGPDGIGWMGFLPTVVTGDTRLDIELIRK